LAVLQSLLAEFAVTVSNGEVWLAIGQALLFGGVSLLFGSWVSRTVGLLRADAPAGEMLGVGLASGLMVLAAWWAAIWSGGRSSFTPVAVGFAVAIALAVVHRERRRRNPDDPVSAPAEHHGDPPPTRRSRNRSLFLALLAGAAFVVLVGLLYGSTLTASPRDGVQPVEFVDEAFYSVLGADLARTGTETTSGPSGFSGTAIEGAPAQTWYHWGEMWLAAAAISVFGTAPVPARSLIVLPLLLLAAAALTGTVARRMTGTDSRWTFGFGFLACLFLAPVPLISGPWFASWAVGMIFGITTYGLSAVAVVFALYLLAAVDGSNRRWALAAFAGTAIALIVPAHIVVAMLAMVGVASAWGIRLLRSLRSTRRLPVVPDAWRRIMITAGIAIAATVAWGVVTGHGLGVGTTPPVVQPFNASWRASVAITAVGAGAFFAIGAAWLLVRPRTTFRADMYLGTMVLLVAGAIGWGALLGQFTMFYLLFAGIAVIATPVAVVAVCELLQYLRRTQHMRLAAAAVALCIIQLEAGAITGVVRLVAFGPRGQVVPVGLLEVIRQLPPDARLAYACMPFSEIGPGTPELLGINAHAGRRVVPMCYEAENLSTLIGAEPSLQVRNLFFESAPQRTLYPDPTADPTPAEVAAFLQAHGIDYIYADAKHPNSLVPDAVPVATSGDGEVLRIP
jgi:hypothetical protein